MHFFIQELKQCEEWARTRGVPFPPIDITEEDVAKDGTKECYVFSNPDDDMCPVVVHFVLINDSFRRYKAPGKDKSSLGVKSPVPRDHAVRGGGLHALRACSKKTNTVNVGYLTCLNLYRPNIM